MKWTPDGCAVMLSWSKGGISLWSTFGTMLMCSLGWDYGLHVDLANKNPLDITCMDWSTEGYQLLMLRQQKTFLDDTPETSMESNSPETAETKKSTQKPTLTHTYSNLSEKSFTGAPPPETPHTIRTQLIQLDFVKSSFTVNPSMVSFD